MEVEDEQKFLERQLASLQSQTSNPKERQTPSPHPSKTGTPKITPVGGTPKKVRVVTFPMVYLFKPYLSSIPQIGSSCMSVFPITHERVDVES